jgi:hypothetical protein
LQTILFIPLPVPPTQCLAAFKTCTPNRFRIIKACFLKTTLLIAAGA